MKEGRFVELCNYSFSTDIYDTNRIGEFGLKRADLDAQYAGGFADSAVGITFITMNDDTIGARFGYNNAFCPGAAQVNKMVDEQYYSKGKCTYFPFPSEKMEISTLLNISK